MTGHQSNPVSRIATHCQRRTRVAAVVASAVVGLFAQTAAAEPQAAVPVAGANAKPAAQPKLEINVDVLLPRKLTPSWPKTVEQSKAEAEAARKPADTWAPAVIAAAKARCDVILKKINAVAIPEAPIKEGACGTPAPVQLISIGKKPQVAISPPATVTCELAEALSQWLENDLQPLARKHVGAEIIKIETMSSYSCRNAYGRATNKLSEHGVANALDIRGFVTALAQTANVLQDWGKPNREVLAEIAAAKAAEAKGAAIKAAAERAAQLNQMAKQNAAQAAPPNATASSVGAPAAGIAKSTIADGLPKLTVTLPGAKRDEPSVSGYGIAEPARLGGPRAQSAPVVRKQDFLHAAHVAACKIFGTTLGPEANEAHRNHFHVDMAERKSGIKICD